MKPLKLPSQEELRRLFDYDSETGKLVRRGSGKIAGTIDERYLKVTIQWRVYPMHRVIWKWVTGEDPSQIDHKDGDGTNNRFDNLRLATDCQNKQNRRKGRNNTSGFKGVYYERNAWVACIQVNKRRIKLGRFKSMADAIASRRVAVDTLHGEFARHE